MEANVSLELDDVRERFLSRVVQRTSRSAQLLLKSAEIRSLDGHQLTIAVPSEEMRQNTEMISQGLKVALEYEFKTPLNVRWTVDSSLASSVGAPSPTRTVKPAVASVDDDEYSPDVSSIVVTSAADHLITEMFPGAEEIR
jgi:hypothetical protein